MTVPTGSRREVSTRGRRSDLDVRDDEKVFGSNRALQGRLPFGLEIVVQRVGHEKSERRREITAHDFVFVDEDSFEHSLIQVSPDAWPCLVVQVLSRGQQLTHIGQPSVEELPIAVELGHAGFDPCSSERDSFLFLFDRIQVQCARRDCIHQSLLALLQLMELASGLSHCGVTGGQNLVKMLDRQ